MKVTFLSIIVLIILCIITAQAPEANPYDYYNVDTYNCLDIAQDCQRWHDYNGINTTIAIGLFNDSMGHAWLINTDTGENIVGYTPQWEYRKIINVTEYNNINND